MKIHPRVPIRMLSSFLHPPRNFVIFWNNLDAIFPKIYLFKSRPVEHRIAPALFSYSFRRPATCTWSLLSPLLSDQVSNSVVRAATSSLWQPKLTGCTTDWNLSWAVWKVRPNYFEDFCWCRVTRCRKRELFLGVWGKAGVLYRGQKNVDIL